MDPIASGTARRVAERLRGVALVRFSSAPDKGGDGTEGRKLLRFDVLGCAMRFAYREGQELEGDQDLLFATIRRPWTMPFAPFTTRVGATLGNDYFTVSPSVPGEPTCYFRSGPSAIAKDARARPVRTARMPRRGPADRRRHGRPLPEVGEGPSALGAGARVRVRTLRRTPALRFDPYRCGRGLRPKGLVHARRAAHAASRPRARAARALARRPRLSRLRRPAGPAFACHPHAHAHRGALAPVRADDLAAHRAHGRRVRPVAAKLDQAFGDEPGRRRQPERQRMVALLAGLPTRCPRSR